MPVVPFTSCRGGATAVAVTEKKQQEFSGPKVPVLVRRVVSVDGRKEATVPVTVREAPKIPFTACKRGANCSSFTEKKHHDLKT